MIPKKILSLSIRSLAALLAMNFYVAAAFGQKTTITVRADGEGKAISPLLMGIFFEDISNAADGGLYAELVQNRSFEFQPIKQNTWNNLTAWELVKRGDAKGSVVVDDAFPIHPNNPHYVVLANETPGDGVCLVNSGFFAGIPVTEGETYDVALFARQQFIGRRWGGAGKPGTLPLSVRLETKAGVVLGETTFPVSEREWRRFSGTIKVNQTDPAARLVLLTDTAGGMALDDISLFPQKTFRNRQNGLRADLAQAIADLKPRFMRFPGGCLVHGNGLGNMYRWKDTIGPIEQRRQQYNLWGYHQTVGLGYYEYFQFCEDIGAKPLPVVAAGVCCQNSGHGVGQSGLPLEQMPAYIQEVLDLIEWANGPVTSTWGAKRAAAGHPAPFNLEYLGVGNEDEITPVFKERFKMIYDVVKQKHPEITVIGTVGPMPDGEDFEKGWKIADEFRVPMVDEHYYKSPKWFWENLQRYDSYDRTKSKVYVGEYAAHDDKRRSTQRSAIAEAAYLTSLERNGDVVLMASYAPLLARRENTNWRPDLIYFNGTEVFPTINYHVQQLFGVNSGDKYLETKIDGAPTSMALAASAVRDTKTGDLILKFVNGGETARPLHIDLIGVQKLASTATATVLAAQDASVVNEDGKPPVVQPVTSKIPVGPSFDYEAPANSLTVVRLKRQ
ncbi:MAG: alpha-L-arabinofuranosidase C-terminal domain-containing protein [Nibricoccus sp.]